MPPSEKAVRLSNLFLNRKPTDRFQFKPIVCANFDREYNRFGSWSESVPSTKNGTQWTTTIVQYDEGETSYIYVRDSQNNTQIVNCYERIITSSVDPVAGIVILTSDVIFHTGGFNFNFGDLKCMEFYKALDNLLKGEDVLHKRLEIQMGGLRTPLNIQRANTIKQDLVKRGAESIFVTITFSEKLNLNTLSIEMKSM